MEIRKLQNYPAISGLETLSSDLKSYVCLTTIHTVTTQKEIENKSYFSSISFTPLFLFGNVAMAKEKHGY